MKRKVKINFSKILKLFCLHCPEKLRYHNSIKKSRTRCKGSIQMKFQCFCDISGWNLRSDYVLTHLSLEGMLAMDTEHWNFIWIDPGAKDKTNFLLDWWWYITHNRAKLFTILKNNSILMKTCGYRQTLNMKKNILCIRIIEVSFKIRRTHFSSQNTRKHYA